MKYIISLNGKEYEVEVEKGEATAVYLGDAPEMSAVSPQAEVQAQPAQAQATPAQATVPQGEGEAVTAPMPGAIIAVNVQNGAKVSKGDVLFILEAMKMENEIAAPKDGVITSIVVSKGATVDTGSVLCTIA